MFSLAPILVFLIAGISVALGESDVQARLLSKVQEVYGDRALRILKELLEGFLAPGAGRVATGISAITILYGATRVFIQLQDALNEIWEVELKSRPTIFRSLRRRSAAFGATLVAGVLLLLIVVVLPSLKALTPYVGHLPGSAIIWPVADFIVTWILIAFAFGLVYRVLPNVKLVWCDVCVGALVASFAFIVAQTFVVWYLKTSAIGSVYGAAGSFIVVLFWLYISGQILLLGAEVTRMYTEAFGSHAKLAQALVSDPSKIPS